MRHTKVLIENRKIYANELKEAIENEYNLASIDTNIKNYHELLDITNNCNYFISSGLSRSIDTLTLLGKKADYIDKIFTEIEFPYTTKKIMKLSLFTWAFLFRLAWIIGFSGGSKSYKESKIEALEASKILITLARKKNCVMLVGHGLKNRLIAKALKRQGWIESRKMKMNNLDYGIFEIKKDIKCN